MKPEATTRMATITRAPTRPPPTTSPISQVAAPTRAAIGSVMNHATAIRPATRQRTWAPGLPRPLPRMEPVATCVVESANPSWLEARMTAAAAPWAAVPWRGSISVMPLPMVRMIRQPPT